MGAGRIAAISLLGAGLAAAAQPDWVGRPLISAYALADIGRDDPLWCAVRDARGAMHFGGDGMLNFDGQTWTHVSANGAAEVRGLAAAGDGRIYAAAAGELGWFEYSDRLGWSYHSLLPALPAGSRDVGSLWNVFAQADGGAVFVGTHALYWWNGRQFTIQQVAGARRISAFETSGRLLVDDRQTGLWQYEPGGRRRLLSPDGLQGAAIVWAAFSRGDRTGLLATTRGFFRATGGMIAPAFPEASRQIRHFGLSAVEPLADGRLALGTLRGGVVLLDGDGSVLQPLNRHEGLPTDEIFGLYADDEHGLWAMSSGDAVRISLNPVRFFPLDAEAGDHATILLDRMGTTLADITHAGDVLLEDRPGRFSMAYGLNRHCWCALRAPEGMVVARIGGIDRIGLHGATTLFRGGGTFSALAWDRDGESLLVALDRSICRVRPETAGAAILVSRLPALVTSIAEDGSGTLWMGTTRRGILMARAQSHFAPESAPAFGGGEGPGLVAQTPERGFAFTASGGWVRSRLGAFRAIERFPRRVTAAVAFAGEEEPWLIHPNADGTGPCLARIVFPDPGDPARAVWQPRQIEGLWRVGVPEYLHVEADGSVRRIWVAGTAGLLQAEIDLREPSATPPAPRLRLLDRSEGAVTIRAETGRLALRPALAIESWVEGVDRGWLRDGAANRRLAALRPGRYRVRARVVDAAGEAGPEADAVFLVPEPWWRRPWSLGAWTVLALGAVALWHRLRSAGLRARAAALQAKVRERTAELERVTAEKSRLVAGISHEIRNPLNGLIGIALALDDTELGTRQRELLHAMRACAAHLSGMMEDVIDFARLETGRAEVRPGPCSPREILEDAVALIRHDAGAAGSRIRIEVAANVPATLLADATRVRQILVNFLSNAVKFAGGEIQAALAVSPCGTELVYSVTDRGPGIGEADKQRLFLPFERLREASPGAGLGLATSKRWAELMGGRIRLTSEAGQGCRFEFSLPCVAAPEPRAQPCDSRWSVLLVEDEDYSAWATTAVAARMGLTVQERARTEAEAVRLVDRRPFDLVLVDQRLPDGEGRVVCERVRRSPRGGQTMIVAISGAEAGHSWRAAGADAFVPKPITPEKLGAALATAVRLRPLRFLSDGTAEGFEREAARYGAQLRALQAALQAAVDSGVASDVRAAAHRLEGHFRILDAAGGVAACAALERDPRERKLLEQVAAAAAEVESLLGQTGPKGDV